MIKRNKSNSWSVVRAVLAAVVVGCIVLPASAQIPLTADQLRQLQALNPNRDAVTDQPTVDPASVTPIEIAPRAISAGALLDNIEQDIQARQGEETLVEDVEVQSTDTPLRQFGYELFAGSPTTFAPATNIPVPSNYVIGPGDTVLIQLYGQQNITYELVITREGMMLFPQIGPVSVAGLNFDQLRERIDNIVQTQLIGQQAAVTLGALRSIQVFILGEAFRPGAYTVSSLSTMTNALLVSGGITNIGSLRNIQLLRQGTLIAELDLYDLLLRGDTSADVRLLPGDVLFIPPIGATVGVAGEVRRPAIYELKDESSAQELITISGGYLASAFPSASRIERIDDNDERTLIDADLSSETGQQLAVRDGDLIQVFSILDRLENVVLLEGHVSRPGGFAWRPGLRVTDVLPAIEDMQPNPDLDFALIAREQVPMRRIEVIHLNLRQAFANPGSVADLQLQPRDRIIVFGARQTRQEQFADLLGMLRAQGTFEEPSLIVSVTGNVEYPGEYPLVSNMTVESLIRFSGGLQVNSELEYLIIERDDNNIGDKSVLALSLTGNAFEAGADFALVPGDNLVIFNTTASRDSSLTPILANLDRQASNEDPARVVSISGSVRYPGSYPLTSDMSVSQLITAAGGYLQSAEVTEAELTSFKVQGFDGRQIEHYSINLRDSGVNGLDHRLEAFDQLMIRQIPNWSENETVILGGEVRSPGTYTIIKDEGISSLIARAGGLTQYADLDGSIFLREELRINEQRMLDQYVEELKSSMATQQLQNRGETGVSNIRSGPQF